MQEGIRYFSYKKALINGQAPHTDSTQLWLPEAAMPEISLTHFIPEALLFLLLSI
jgi:hypothetical protein